MTSLDDKARRPAQYPLYPNCVREAVLLEALEEEAIAVEQRQTVPGCSPDWVLIRGPSSPGDNAHWVQHNSHSPNCNQNPMIRRLKTNRPGIVGHRTCAIWIRQTLEGHQRSQ